MKEVLRQAIADLQTPSVKRFAVVVDRGDGGLSASCFAGDGADDETTDESHGVAEGWFNAGRMKNPCRARWRLRAGRRRWR